MTWTRMDRMVAEARRQYGLLRERPKWTSASWKEKDEKFSKMLSGVLEKFCVPFDERATTKKELGRRLQKYAPRKTKKSRDARHTPMCPDNNPHRAFFLSLPPGTQLPLVLKFFDEYYPCVS